MDNFLQKKFEQVRSSSEMLLENTRDWQTIKMYIHNRFDGDLTAIQKSKLERYQFIYNQICSGKYLKQQILKQLQRFFQISQAQSYDDYNATTEIFSTTFNINKLFELTAELEICKKMRMEAAAAGDHRAAAAFSKVILAINKEIPEKEDNLAELFEGHVIEAGFDPSLLGNNIEVDMKKLLAKINEKRKVKIQTDLFEDINFEDLSNAEETPLQ